MSSSTTVLVTGATGFIAQWVVDKLLARGYSVIGTARSEARYSPILEQFKEKYPEGKLSFKVVADIAEKNAFDEVLKNHPEITKVIHTASPFAYGLNKPLEEAYLNPAVNGTVNILKATKAYAPQVTNVVVTSSYAAVRQPAAMWETHEHTDKSWNPITWDIVANERDAYNASKTCAERAAREFVAEEKPNFRLATVNPPLVFGPQVFDSSVTKILNTSNENILKIARNEESAKSFASLAVDVRDVAELHILPFEKEQLAEQREFVVSSTAFYSDILTLLKKNFPNLSLSEAQETGEKITQLYDVSNLTEKIGGYEFISLENSVVDLLTQYLKVYKTL